MNAQGVYTIYSSEQKRTVERWKLEIVKRGKEMKGKVKWCEWTQNNE